MGSLAVSEPACSAPRSPSRRSGPASPGSPAGTPTRRPSARRSARRPSTPRRGRSPTPWPASSSSSSPCPSASLVATTRDVLAAAGADDDRHRRRLDEARARAGDRRRALRAGPSARRRRDRRPRSRRRGPLRRRDVVPDAADVDGHVPRRARRAVRRDPRRAHDPTRRRDPRPAARADEPSPPCAREPAHAERRRGRRRGARLRRRVAARDDARRGREPGRLGRHLRRERRSDRRRARRARRSARRGRARAARRATAPSSSGGSRGGRRRAAGCSSTPTAPRRACSTASACAIPDKPGVLARITQTLGAAGINIEDFELRHVSPEYGGVLVILVSGARERRARADAASPRGLLRRLGSAGVLGAARRGSAPPSSVRRGRAPHGTDRATSGVVPDHRVPTMSDDGRRPESAQPMTASRSATATACVRVRAPSFVIARCAWARTVSGERKSDAPISA